MTAPVESPIRAYVLDPLERAGSTFAEQFVTLLLPLLVIVQVAGHAKLAITWDQFVVVLDTSAFAAVVSILTSVLTFKVPKQSAAVDLLLRVGKTYLQSVLATITLAAALPSVLHADWRTALLAGIPVAGAALLKGLGSIALPWTVGASLLTRPEAPGKHQLDA